MGGRGEGSATIYVRHNRVALISDPPGDTFREKQAAKDGWLSREERQKMTLTLALEVWTTHRKRRVSGGVSRCVFSLVLVVIQRSAEVAGLHLRALPANQVGPAVALAALHRAPIQ